MKPNEEVKVAVSDGEPRVLGVDCSQGDDFYAIAEAPKEPETVPAVVTNCVMLNVRERPNKYSKVIANIPLRTKLNVGKGQGTKDFHKVILSDRTEGFCMKNFIEIES